MKGRTKHKIFCFVDVLDGIIEPRREKTSLRGFRPGLTQTRLHTHRRWLGVVEELYYPYSD